jgi:hypothetical protein
VWRLQRGGPPATAATGASLALCRVAAAAPGGRGHPLSMSHCVLFGAGRA